jgi:two-component sensor histidine kinase
MTRPDDQIVEARPRGPKGPGRAQRALDQRIRQQEILSELGVAALKETPFPELLDRSVRAAAEGLQAELAKVLEYMPDEKRLLMRAGVGWEPGLVGTAKVEADLASPSGYALRTGKPVISNHLENEKRFRTPKMLAEHGVRRAMNVILPTEGMPYGILEVDSRSEGEFDEKDIAFLQGVANILGMAIQRQRQERGLKAALEHQKTLVKEINHRVKNSLQLAASMLSLQARDDPLVSAHLQEAVNRITAIARAHDRLYRTPRIDSIDLGGYLAEVCADLGKVVGRCRVRYEPPQALPMHPDRAIRIALLVSELVTNSAKHAYPQDQGGDIQVSLTRGNKGAWRIGVSDQGIGLPADFDLTRGKSMGLRLVQALTQQTKATIRVERLQPGTEFIIDSCEADSG